MYEFQEFENGEALADALTVEVAGALAHTIRLHGKAALALSGGKTPVRFLEALSRYRMPWNDVVVTLVDERWVPETDVRSNAGLARRHLLKGPLSNIEFVPLYRPVPTPEEAVAEVGKVIADLPLPFAAVVLGMGDDGHTASFYPGGDNLAAANSPDCKAQVMAIRAEAAIEPRITLTLPLLLAADEILLHIEGTEKRAAFEKAVAGDDVLEMPVRSLLNSEKLVKVLWCP
ncbi:MAG: pgl 2 [Proteobacteria bacterium]|nr:pgl 2 [Pseudomonadota bacterium]